MLSRLADRRAKCGVTLLEVVTVILVIGILVTMLLPLFSLLKARSQKASCIANLRSLHVAANLYIQENHQWPQIGSKGEPKTVATNWINALNPYGLTQANWLCPTVQGLLANPDMTDSDNARIDYISTPFDTKPQTPFQWAKQPWFVESADVHGNGNLILFPDGHIQELGDFRAMLKKPGSAASTH